MLFRRSRGDFDGPFPVYAPMGEQKIPLSEDQCTELNRQAIDLAGRPASEIKILIEQMLLADQSGTAPPMDLAGFMREQEPYDGSRKKFAANAPNNCDQCGRDLNKVGFFFDACTIENMLWSWMCPPCFFGLGCGVGNGYGQLYLREHGEEYIILGEPPADTESEI